ncbi:hypothetical protein GOP47_0029998 [Adiantum capillus-veneris]|nr:hypothetical protein GOP47_0029998 [Adiantum capillus-veneris]
MAPFIAPSSELALNIGDIERKVDMSLDDIIKQSKGMDKKHTKVKDWNRTRNMQPAQALHAQKSQIEQQKGQRPFRRGLQQKRELQQGRVPQQRKELLQRFVALRSSALRQEKLKEARSRTGASMLVTSKPAGRQALPGNVIAPLNRFGRKASQGSTRLIGATARQPKIMSAARNTKTVIVNQLSMAGATRRPASPHVVSLARGGMPAQRQNWRPNKAVANASVRRPQTLDSRFASLREERQLQSQFGSRSGWRR